jgi:hypothetical protein
MMITVVDGREIEITLVAILIDMASPRSQEEIGATPIEAHEPPMEL